MSAHPLAVVSVGLVLAAAFGCHPAIQRSADPPNAAPGAGVQSGDGVAPVSPPTVPRPLPVAQANAEPPSAPFAADWQWLRTRFPEAARYRPAEDDALLGLLLDWARPGEATTLFSRGCGAVSVRREADQLHGYVHRGFTLDAERLAESVEEIMVGSRLEIQGCNLQEYERNAEGIWEPAGSGGGGCLSELGLALSKVTAEGAWYDDALVTLSVECTERVEQAQSCRDGQHRSCSRCDAWGLSAHSNESGVGFQSAATTRKARLATPADCSTPCPPGEPPEDIRRAASMLEERGFLRAAETSPHPFVFRTEAACRAYRKQHHLSPAELDAWRGDASVQSGE